MQDNQTSGIASRRDLRAWFSRMIGAREEHKEEVYVDLSQSAALHDGAYWLQIFFACGIATLGLIMNSPAVIIGAMLISPLMGPILACGLALAAGDLVLGLRATAKVVASCLMAVAFSFALTTVLPFKEMTPEIMARIRPNTLDLVIALFSGAIGAIAILRGIKGGMTSVPGVAIAVALMPPLCVVGYGLGVAVDIDGVGGMDVARGGMLLFLTNFVAITFMAMVVFIATHIDTDRVKEKVRQWREHDLYNLRLQRFLDHTPIRRGIRRIGSPVGRLLPVFAFVLILIPLTHSFNHLSEEISRQREENRIRKMASDVWQESFERYPDGTRRSYIDQMVTSIKGGMPTLHLRVFSATPYGADERSRFNALIASRLGLPADSLRMEFVEIPTSAPAIARDGGKESIATIADDASVMPHAAIISAVLGARFPTGMRPLGYELLMETSDRLRGVVRYLADHDLSGDAAMLVADELRLRMNAPDLAVAFERIPMRLDTIRFARAASQLAPADSMALAAAAGHLLHYPQLRLMVTVADTSAAAAGRIESIRSAILSGRALSPDRIVISGRADTSSAPALSIVALERAR